MLSKIPLPTDNIYKFYALFGLLILLTTGVMFFIRHTEYNNMAFERYIPIEVLKAKDILSADEIRKLYILQQQQLISTSDKDFELGTYLFLFFSFGIFFTTYGFYQWHTKIQPRQDKLLDLQLRKAEYDLNNLSSSSSSKKNANHLRRIR